MTKLTLNYYIDPSHGWVKVPIKTLIKLNIAHKITTYSYMRGLYAYLEEDCDLSSFLAAADKEGIKIVLREYNSNKLSKIRSYDRYQFNRLSNECFTQWLKDNGKLELITIGG